MSCVPVKGDGAEACANCGSVSIGTVKLKDCTACRLVKYCGVDCQRAHRKQHKKACKQRAAELKDEQLYSQGHERPEGDYCPICTLPIPLPVDKHSGLNVCCMKRICNGCDVAAKLGGMNDCVFCRTPFPKIDDDIPATIQKRVSKKDPLAIALGEKYCHFRAKILAMIQTRVAKKDHEAINFLGEKYSHGSLGLQRDMRRAVHLWEEAAELGSIEALCHLGVAFHEGEAVQRDKAKGDGFFERAAMQGHVESRFKLGVKEALERNHDRALKHYLISAKMGHESSLDLIKDMFMGGTATKEQYADALKGYQDAVEEMKSHDRDIAKRYSKALEEESRRSGLGM